MNRKIAMSAFSIVASLALMGGATFAYFTDVVNSEGNTFATGSLEIDVTNSVVHQPSAPITNMQPGETSFVRFDVTNTGSLPVNLRAFAVGDWVGEGLDNNLIKVTQVQYWDQVSSDWVTIISNSSGINGIVYYSPNGLDASLFELASSQTEQFRLTVMLDPTADSTYENKTYNSNVQVHAKQTTNGATWPDPIAIP